MFRIQRPEILIMALPGRRLGCMLSLASLPPTRHCDFHVVDEFYIHCIIISYPVERFQRVAKVKDEKA